MKHHTLADVGEDALVRRLTRGLPLTREVLEGAGDDCAIVQPLRKGWLQLLKTDCIVEGTHFTPDADLRRVGWKAMARAVSDIAAMGGQPQHAMITLLAPPERRVRDMENLYAGLKKCARAYGVSIVGGETARAPLLAITVSLTGKVEAKKRVQRDGARAGDLIFVTGRHGGSIRGRHLDFKPRVAEAQWLVKNFRPTAMMDLSDGLAKDLPRMAVASGLDFIVSSEDLPRNKGCTAEQAWSDGEDYELLLAVPGSHSMLGCCRWAEQFPKVPLTLIGKFVPKGKGDAPFAAKGWEHFTK